jgi:hypothetical protein
LNSSGGSELAINIFDGKLFYKDSSGNVQVIGWKIVPVSAGGTGQTSYTDGQLLIGNSTGNTLTKATLTAGTGITITNGSGAITINGTGGTVTSVAALTLGTTGTDLSSTVANGTTTPVITLNVPTASATNRGALSAADWTTFNNKQPAGTYVTNLTGPITSVGNATSIASQTGTGTKFVMDTSPTITGATLTTAALNGSLGATTPSTVAATSGTFSDKVSCTTRSDIISTAIVQGTPVVIKIVKPIPAVSLGTKLRIPFISQGTLNHQVVLKVWGTTAKYNATTPSGFECSASIAQPAGSAPTIQATWGTGGNYASMAIVGQYLEIAFTSAYTSATNNGIVMILEYVTPNESISINVAGIVMN